MKERQSKREDGEGVEAPREAQMGQGGKRALGQGRRGGTDEELGIGMKELHQRN